MPGEDLRNHFSSDALGRRLTDVSRRERYILIMATSDVEIGDAVMVHGIHTGKVVDKFLSATGAEVYDIKLVYGPFRVAALEDHIIINFGPRANGL